jgi:hypothetical protein
VLSTPVVQFLLVSTLNENIKLFEGKGEGNGERRRKKA